jgi:hypothetical protein
VTQVFDLKPTKEQQRTPVAMSLCSENKTSCWIAFETACSASTIFGGFKRVVQHQVHRGQKVDQFIAYEGVQALVTDPFTQYSVQPLSEFHMKTQLNHTAPEITVRGIERIQDACCLNK